MGEGRRYHVCLLPIAFIHLAERDMVTLQIFNILGQPVRTLVDEKQGAGEKNVIWDGDDEAGKSVTSGTYFYELRVGEEVKAKKMLLLK